MKLRPLLSAFIVFVALASSALGVELLETDFEASTSLPSGWTSERISGEFGADWKIGNGGTENTFFERFPDPPNAHGGSRNAFLWRRYYSGVTTRLISPVFDSSAHVNLSLNFWHAQVDDGGENTQGTLKVLYSSDGGTTWSERAYYDTDTATWTQRTILLGQPSANSRIAFEGVYNRGNGVCLDDIQITAAPAGSLPVVSVTAGDAEASEEGADAGTWTISRTGATTESITVHFSLSGTATPTDDYSVSHSGSVTLGVGEASTTVTLTPVDDSEYDELDETAILTLSGDPAYGIGADLWDTITIADNDDSELKVLIIGSSTTSEDVSAFNPSGIRDQLHNILNQAGFDGVRVDVLDRSREGTQNVYSLSQWYHHPYPAEVETTTRWPNLRGELDYDWDYVVLIGDPWTMENIPGLYAHGVGAVAAEVAKGSTPEKPAETVLFMPWPASTSASSVDHYREAVYRAGRTGGHKVAPAALAWQDDGSPTDAARCDYISAASIYSRIWGQSASSSGYVYDDVLADSVDAVVSSNVGAPQYSGWSDFNNPYLMLGDKRRLVRFAANGTSTEGDYAYGAGQAMIRARVTHAGLSGTGGTRNLPLAWIHGRSGRYYNNFGMEPDRYQLQMGFSYQDPDTHWMPVDQANDSQIADMFRYDINQVEWMINYNWETARNLPMRFLWARFHQKFPDQRPIRDGAGHINEDLRIALGSFMYTMYSGRCPVDAMPDFANLEFDPDLTEEETEEERMKVERDWFAQKYGYEAAWRMGTGSSRAPGFKVMPSSADADSVTPSSTETMTVQFIFAPRSDVTVQVSSSDETAGIVGLQTLVFTPDNYNIPQSVSVTGVEGSPNNAPFEVVYTTSSDDPAFDGVTDSWAYSCTRSSSTVSHVDHGTTSQDTPKNFDLTLELPVAGANEANTSLTTPAHGSLAWNGTELVYTPDTDYVGPDGLAYSVLHAGTVTTGYIEIDVTASIPDGSVRTEVIDSSAAEEGQATGSYSIIREGSTASALEVNFTLGGTATFGDDYVLSTSSPLTIPAGQASVTVTLTPVDDSVFGEQIETATFTLAAGAGYRAITNPGDISIADNDNNVPEVDAGSDQSVRLNASSPGLLYGEVPGNIDTTTPNPQTALIADVAAYTEDSISPETTEIYTGQIYDADGQISFTERIDDRAHITIDGVVVIDNGSAGSRTNTENLDLSPGWHDIEIRIANGTGGSGPKSFPGIGYDPNGGTNWQTLSDPGDGSFLRVFSLGEVLVNLDGTVTDPEETPVTIWTLQSGPGTVDIANTADTDTLATFYEAGTYVLRLSADDGYGPIVDEVTITIADPVPEITVSATDATASEPGTDTATWTITRSREFADPLEVSFTLGGDAVEGADFTIDATSPVTIPAGESSVAVTLTAVDDSTLEIPETASLLISAAPTYSIGSAEDITIADDDNTPPLTDAGEAQTIHLAISTWTPSELSPVAWYDASDAGTLWADDGVTPATSTVQRWDDRSGNGNHAVAGGDQPGYNSGSSSVSGSSTTSMALPNDLYAAATSGCVVWVGTQDSGGGGWGNYGSDNNIHSPWTNGYMYSAFLSNSRPQASTPTSGLVGKQTMQSRVQTGTHLEMWSDGALVYNGARSFINTPNETKLFDYGSYTLNEVMFLPDADVATREEAEGYLAHKWGLQASLPEGHPYAFAAPGNGEVTTTLAGSVTDPEQTTTATWSVVSGPGSVLFSDVNALHATVTFNVAGTYVLQLTGDDGYDTQTDTVIITVNPSPPADYLTWSESFGTSLTDTAPTANPDFDAMSNMMEYAFGTDPTLSDSGPLAMDGSKHGGPVLSQGPGDVMEFYFIRRKDHGQSGSLNYTVQFSADLSGFIDNDNGTNPLNPVDDFGAQGSEYELIKVAYPEGYRFGRVRIDFAE